jgi:hypothetical protein
LFFDFGPFADAFFACSQTLIVSLWDTSFACLQPAFFLFTSSTSSTLYYMGLWAAELLGRRYRAPKRLEGGGEMSLGKVFVFIFYLASLLYFSLFFLIILFITLLHMDL